MGLYQHRVHLGGPAPPSAAQPHGQARLPGDLERFFGPDAADLTVQETRAADYRYRCTVSEAVFASALQRAAEQIDYPSFRTPSRRMTDCGTMPIWMCGPPCTGCRDIDASGMGGSR
ncbi:MAG: hypothetical protein IPP45_16375 [Sphingomonadales bacterium]|nr:hypothetical protein [Sphingomonadales bacterium]